MATLQHGDVSLNYQTFGNPANPALDLLRTHWAPLIVCGSHRLMRYKTIFISLPMTRVVTVAVLHQTNRLPLNNWAMM